jgi:hypothetical protein
VPKGALRAIHIVTVLFPKEIKDGKEHGQQPS